MNSYRIIKIRKDRFIVQRRKFFLFYWETEVSDLATLTPKYFNSFFIALYYIREQKKYLGNVIYQGL